MNRLLKDNCCSLILTHALTAGVLALFAGCGDSDEIEPPFRGDVPDFSDCKEAERTFRSLLPWSPLPLPFEGARSVPLSTWKPDEWEQFEGSIYLIEVEGDIDWLRYLRVSFVDHPDVAVWDGERWEVDPSVDLKPFMDPRGERLFFVPFLEAKGTKPAGAPRMSMKATVALCGSGKELIQ